MKDPINYICVVIIVIAALSVLIINNGCKAFDGFKADVLEKVKEKVDKEVEQPEKVVIVAEEPTQSSDIELVKKLKFNAPAHDWMARAGSKLINTPITMNCWKDGAYVFCDGLERAPVGQAYLWYGFDSDFNYVGYSDNSGSRGGPLIIDHSTPIHATIKYLICCITDGGKVNVYERSLLKELKY